jgi:TonB family protein
MYKQFAVTALVALILCLVGSLCLIPISCSDRTKEVDASSDYIPGPDEFVPVEKIPQPVLIPDPEYPEEARRNGIEGYVWVRVLINKDGTVREAIIEKESPTGMAFGDSAVDAALRGEWTPAIQDGTPVYCWVTYKVEFVLD